MKGAYAASNCQMEACRFIALAMAPCFAATNAPQVFGWVVADLMQS